MLSYLIRREDLSDQLNLTIFRLSCCCGLRCSEICGLNLADVVTAGPRPAIRVRKAVGKGKKGRLVPLWWDKGTLQDIAAWRAYRLMPATGARLMGASLNDPFVARLRGTVGERFLRQEVSKRWATAIKCLGPDRVRQLSIHSGRHSFVSHSLRAGRSLAEVRDAAGHSNVSTTSIYLHYLEREGVPDVFGGQPCHGYST